MVTFKKQNKNVLIAEVINQQGGSVFPLEEKINKQSYVASHVFFFTEDMRA